MININSNDCSHLTITYWISYHSILGCFTKKSLNDQSSHDTKKAQTRNTEGTAPEHPILLGWGAQALYFQTGLVLTDFNEADQSKGKEKAANLKWAIGSMGFSMQKRVWLLQ